MIYAMISLCHENYLTLCETCAFLHHSSRWKHTIKYKIPRPLTTRGVKYTTEKQTGNEHWAHEAFQCTEFFSLQTVTLFPLVVQIPFQQQGFLLKGRNRLEQWTDKQALRMKTVGMLVQRGPLGWFVYFSGLEHPTKALAALVKLKEILCKFWQNKEDLGLKFRLENKTWS